MAKGSRGGAARRGHQPAARNAFLHYVLDLWVHQWRKRTARGRVIIVRYADDSVVGFQYMNDARSLLASLMERMAKFKLTLHEEKTRVIEFGRLPAIDHKRRVSGIHQRSSSWASRTTVAGLGTDALWSNARRRASGSQLS